MTDPEWIEGDWETVEVGDLVKLTNIDNTLFATVQSTWRDVGIRKFDIHAFGSTTGRWTVLESDGWSLFVQATPKPVLPTEPGIYVGHDQMTNNSAFVVRVTPDGELQYPLPNREGGWNRLGTPERFAPFTRLAAVADTAKAVLDRLADRSIRSFVPNAETTYKLFSSDFDKVASEFGVTNDLP